jgi:hypothetical protein
VGSSPTPDNIGIAQWQSSNYPIAFYPVNFLFQKGSSDADTYRCVVLKKNKWRNKDAIQNKRW